VITRDAGTRSRSDADGISGRLRRRRAPAPEEGAGEVMPVDERAVLIVTA
jgi:hypothetical protein